MPVLGACAQSPCLTAPLPQLTPALGRRSFFLSFTAPALAPGSAGACAAGAEALGARLFPAPDAPVAPAAAAATAAGCGWPGCRAPGPCALRTSTTGFFFNCVHSCAAGGAGAGHSRTWEVLQVEAQAPGQRCAWEHAQQNGNGLVRSWDRLPSGSPPNLPVLSHPGSLSIYQRVSDLTGGCHTSAPLLWAPVPRRVIRAAGVPTVSHLEGPVARARQPLGARHVTAALDAQRRPGGGVAADEV